MRYKRTPDENGWYWIEDEYGEWWMAYLDAESDPQRLTMVDSVVGMFTCWSPVSTATGTIGKRTVKGDAPIQWIGPIRCPGGVLGADQAYFSAEDYDKAEATGQSLVMVYVDTAGIPHRTGATVGLVPPDEAWKAMDRAFPPDRDSGSAQAAEAAPVKKRRKSKKLGNRDADGKRQFRVVS